MTVPNSVDGPRRAVLISAPTTPFTADGELDLAAARKLLEHLDPHVDAVMLAGTMGEFPALSQPERLALFELGLEVYGPARVIAHVGTESARNSIRLAHATVALGVQRLALITPYYLPASPDEVAEHFRRVTGSVPGQWYGYLFPERTGVAMQPHQLARIVDTCNLTGFKISGASCARLGEYVAACSPEREFYSGYDAGFPQALVAGAAGIVSGFSSAFPRAFRALADALARRDERAVKAAQDTVLRIMSVMGQSVGSAKVAQSLAGLGEQHARMPLQFPAHTRDIQRLISAFS